MRRSRYRARKYWQTHLWKGVTCFLTCQLAEAEAAYYQVMQKACWVLRSWIHILNCSTCAFISNNCSNTNCSFHKNAIFRIKKTNKRIHEGTELCSLVTETGPEGTAWSCVRGGSACQGKAVPRGRWAQPNLPELRECLGTALTHGFGIVWCCCLYQHLDMVDSLYVPSNSGYSDSVILWNACNTQNHSGTFNYSYGGLYSQKKIEPIIKLLACCSEYSHLLISNIMPSIWYKLSCSSAIILQCHLMIS